MHNIAVFGAGKIGALTACRLADTKEYRIILLDKNLHGQDFIRLNNNSQLTTHCIDVQDASAMQDFFKKHKLHAIVSCLPYFCTRELAEYAKQFHLHYFDLTEDVQVTEYIKTLAKDAEHAFIPQCGLAPGMISIIANSMMLSFDELDTVKLRVGALPVNANNALQYSLTWSTDGLINEYGNPCFAVQDGAVVKLQPLEGLESVQVDGLSYEAFNTSGGLGSLLDTYKEKIRTLNYKTLRYPGHCSKMQFLMKGLNLNHDRKTLKYILENAIPKTYQDVVLIYIAISGTKNGEYTEENFVNKIYPQTLLENHWSAIQISTTSGLCTVIDSVFSEPDSYKGFIPQERFAYSDMIQNRFGKCFMNRK